MAGHISEEQCANSFKARIVFCFWTGAEDMSDQRKSARYSMVRSLRCPLLLLEGEEILLWQRPEAPFHPAYKFLSSTHKSDYLRCYFMHHYGGGYSDIKHTVGGWSHAFARLAESEALALGYCEVSEQGVAPVDGVLGEELRRNYKQLIGNCAYIFKPQTPLTEAWLSATNAFLDRALAPLTTHPAKHPQDQPGIGLQDGTISQYPVRWTALLGEIFHPIVYHYRSVILQDSINPIFHSYR